MEVSILNQLVTALLSIFLGVLCVVIYQVFKIPFFLIEGQYSYKFKEKMRDKVFLPILNPVNKVKKKRILKSILLILSDFSYFLFITPIFVLFFYETSNGIVRWYVFFFSIIGFLIFEGTVGKLATKTIEYISFYIQISFSYITYMMKKQFKKIFKRKKKRTHKDNKENKILISYGK